MLACANAFVACRSAASSAEVRMATGVGVVASAPPMTPTLLARIARCRCRHSGSSVPESISLPFRIMFGQTAHFVTSGCVWGTHQHSPRPPGNPHYRYLTEGVQFHNAILTAVCGDDHVYFSGSTIARPAGRPLPPLVWSRPDLSRVPCEVAGNDLGVSCQRSAGPGLAADVDVSAFFVWLRFVAVVGRFLACRGLAGRQSPAQRAEQLPVRAN